MNIVQTETASDHIAEAWDLFERHRDELATNPDLMRLAPDRETYERIERSGALFALWCYVDKKLVGYSVNIHQRNMHYSALVFSQNDVLYIAPEHRKNGTGLAIIKATEEASKARGCQMHIWHAKPGTALDALLPRLGYGVQDILYSKVL